MDEGEPLPGTSKQIDNHSDVSHKNSNSDIGKVGNGTASETSVSNSGSENSRIEMGHDRLGNKAAPGRKERKPRERKKKRVRPPGRVVKRTRRVEPKRLVRRRSKRARERKRERRFSVSTVFTKLSGASPIESCPYCGHRCCSRRYYSYYRVGQKKRARRFRNYNQRVRKLKCMATQTMKLVKRNMARQCVQAGSRCLMLSPLCVNASAVPEPPDHETDNPLNSCEITPEMIVQSLRRLSMFRQAVETATILKYLKCNYPVCRGEELIAELSKKLQIATVVGMVRQPIPEHWALSCALMRRRLERSHVSLFWKLYRNSLKPVAKRPSLEIKEEDIT